MDCPFCGKEMKQGVIPGISRWVEDGLDSWEGVKLTSGLLGGTPSPAYFCPDCRQILLPVPESEGLLEAAGRMLDAVDGKIQAAQERWESRQAEKQTEWKTKKSREKGPWEL